VKPANKRTRQQAWETGAVATALVKRLLWAGSVYDSPKIVSRGSLSPGGDRRAPSDSEATVLPEERKRNILVH
jgi:hypothetical protein